MKTACLACGRGFDWTIESKVQSRLLSSSHLDQLESCCFPVFSWVLKCPLSRFHFLLVTTQASRHCAFICSYFWVKGARCNFSQTFIFSPLPPTAVHYPLNTPHTSPSSSSPPPFNGGGDDNHSLSSSSLWLSSLFIILVRRSCGSTSSKAKTM